MKPLLVLWLLIFPPALAAAQAGGAPAPAACGTIADWGAPAQVAAAPAGDALRLSWMPAPEAPTEIAAFEIVRADDLAGPYRRIGLVDGGVRQFIDISAVPGTIYFYRVRALAAGNCTPWSDPVRGLR